MKPSSISRSHSVVESVRSHYAALSRAASLESGHHQNLSKPKLEPLTRSDYKKIIAILVASSTLWTLYGNIATFYPPYRKQFHGTISDTEVGIVLAMFEGGVLLTSPLVGITLSKVGKRNYIYIGCLACIIASIGFGIITHVVDDTLFFIFSILLRIL